jgi:hypothetical protein
VNRNSEKNKKDTTTHLRSLYASIIQLSVEHSKLIIVLLWGVDKASNLHSEDNPSFDDPLSGARHKIDGRS